MIGENRTGGAKLDVVRLVDVINRLDPDVRVMLTAALRDGFPKIIWTTQRGLLRAATHAGYKP